MRRSVPALEQVRGEAVPQRVRGHALGNPRTPRRLDERLVHRHARDQLVRPAPRKQVGPVGREAFQYARSVASSLGLSIT